jgi:hypothetical protein
MCSAPKQGQTLPAGVDLEKETVITGEVEITVAESPSGSGGESARAPDRLTIVVLFYEILLVAAVVLITWFALYALYRLITDES